jgi:hypothetical protein
MERFKTLLGWANRRSAFDDKVSKKTDYATVIDDVVKKNTKSVD